MRRMFLATIMALAMAMSTMGTATAADLKLGPAQFQTHDGINVLVRQICSEDKHAGISVLTRATKNHGSKYTAHASANYYDDTVETTLLKKDVAQFNKIDSGKNTRPAATLRVDLTKPPVADQSKNTTLTFDIERINCVQGELLPNNL